MLGKKLKRTILGGGLFFLAGIVFWGGFNTAMEATNTLSFCISCHEMRNTVYQEYKTSVHFSNPSGVQAGCPDCHVPREWTAKVVRKIKASWELYHWLIGSIDTKEKFEAKRAELAGRVWRTMKATDSRECRNCHNFQVMDFAGQARFASRIHQDAVKAGKTCIDCHKGIAHKLPPMPAPEEAEGKAPMEVDLEYGEEINMTCAPCHGEFGEGKSDGTYPRLAGLDAAYIARQLRNFKQRKRINIPMYPFTTERELPEEDVVTIAAYLSRIKLPTKLPPVDERNFDALDRLRAGQRVLNIPRYTKGNPEAGGRLYRKECATCHGPRGEGNRARIIPPLTGQHSLYLRRQVALFRKGKRIHDSPADAEIFRRFSDSEIDDILAWLSLQDDD